MLSFPRLAFPDQDPGPEFLRVTMDGPTWNTAIPHEGMLRFAMFCLMHESISMFVYLLNFVRSFWYVFAEEVKTCKNNTPTLGMG